MEEGVIFHLEGTSFVEEGFLFHLEGTNICRRGFHFHLEDTSFIRRVVSMVEGVHFFVCMEVPTGAGGAFYTSRAWRVLVLWMVFVLVLCIEVYTCGGEYNIISTGGYQFCGGGVVFFGLQMEGAILTSRISSTRLDLLARRLGCASGWA